MTKSTTRKVNDDRAEALRKKRISLSAKKRKHTDGLIWIIFQVTDNEILRGKSGEFLKDDHGNFQYGPNEEGWENIMDVDVPDWVKQPEVIGQMKNGERVSQDPEKGTKWYRVMLITPPEKH